jgi:hypothetical protein
MVIQAKSVEEYCRNVLISLFSNKYQCWFFLSEDRQIQWVLITGIRLDFGGSISLFVHTMYGFSPLSIEKKEAMKERLIEFSKSIKAQYMIFAPSTPLAVKVCEQVGLEQIAKIFIQKVGDYNE